MKKIDPTKELSQVDFCELFEQLPINDKERNDIKEMYWQLYILIINNKTVLPSEAWVATKNTFIAKESQIKDRIK